MTTRIEAGLVNASQGPQEGYLAYGRRAQRIVEHQVWLDRLAAERWSATLRWVATRDAVLAAEEEARELSTPLPRLVTIEVRSRTTFASAFAQAQADKKASAASMMARVAAAGH